MKGIQFYFIKVFYAVICFYLFLFYDEISAQDYSFKRYTSIESLYPIALNKVFQDSRGILWFGGIGGFSKYDGYKFKTYLQDYGNQIVVKDIAEDMNRKIWIATEGNGLINIDMDRDSLNFLTVENKNLTTNFINCVLFDRQNNLWCGTDKGIIILTADQRIINFNKENRLLRNSVNKMLLDSSGFIWVSDGGLAKLTYKNGKIKILERVHNIPLLSLAIGRDNSILYGTTDAKMNISNGVYRNLEGKHYTILPAGKFNDPIKPQTIYESKDGVVWVGTTRGCFVIGDGKIQRIKNKNGLLNENISDILQDNEGSIWFCTANGAYKLTSRYFISYSEKEGLIFSGILSGTIDSENNAWFGNYSGLYKINSNLNLFVQKEVCESETPQVHSVLQDKNGNIWIGKYLGLMTLQNNLLSDIDFGMNKKNIFIRSMTLDSLGNIYLGMNGEIIQLRNKKIIKLWGKDEIFHHSAITSLTFDKTGKLWFSSVSVGCGFIKNDSIKIFTTKDGLLSNEVNSVFIDSKNRIWVATSIGLQLYDVEQKKFKEILIGKNKRINVRCLNEDSKGNIWIGTDLGVYQWNYKIITHLDSRNGLIGDIIYVILINKNKDILFGTNAGISILKYSSVVAKIPTPKIWVELVSEKNEDKIIKNISEFSYDNNSLQFRIYSPSFFDEQNMEFSYMLEGFENNWSIPSNQRIIKYNYLEPGKYSFLCKAKNRNGLWSNTALINFEILPPYWQQWWFIALMIITFISILISVYLKRINFLKKETAMQRKFSELLIQSQENERKRIASELHDGIGQDLLAIINRVKLSLKKPETHLPEKQFKNILESASKLLEEVRRIARNLHPYQLESIGLTKTIESMLNRFCELTEIQIDYKIKNIDNILPLEKELSILRIIQECLNNIIKHSSANKVLIKINFDTSSISIFIHDDGFGISKKKQDEIFNNKSGFGFWDIQERIKYLNGKFDLESSENTGTSISISIPMGNKSGKENKNIYR